MINIFNESFQMLPDSKAIHDIKKTYCFIFFVLISPDAVPCISFSNNHLATARFDMIYSYQEKSDSVEIGIIAATQYKGWNISDFYIHSIGEDSLYIPLRRNTNEDDTNIMVLVVLPLKVSLNAEVFIGYGYSGCNQYYMKKKITRNTR